MWRRGAGPRPFLVNFQVSPAMGASILVHVAAMDDTALQSNVKYVMRYGEVAIASRGGCVVDGPLGTRLLTRCLQLCQ